MSPSMMICRRGLMQGEIIGEGTILKTEYLMLSEPLVQPPSLA